MLVECVGCGARKRKPPIQPGVLAGADLWVCEECGNTNVIAPQDVEEKGGQDG